MLRHFSTELGAQSCSPNSLVSYEWDDGGHVNAAPATLKLLSYNIQVGIDSKSYRHYLTRSWRHVLPHPRREDNLKRIAELLSRFDIVALQEVDGGSMRTGNLNQVEYLATAAGFPYWYQQLTRNLGKFAQQGNGVLSRIRPSILEDHKLPSLLPGRGAILLRYGDRQNPLVLVMLHLSLGRRSRMNQLAYVKEMIADYKQVVVMGDLNSCAERVLKLSPLSEANLQSPLEAFNTYPSWRPIHNYDHILVSSSLKIMRTEVVPYLLSDHLPVSMEIELPIGS